MIYIKYFPNFENYDKKLQQFLMFLTLNQKHLIDTSTITYLNSNTLIRCNQIFKSFKSNQEESLQETDFVKVNISKFVFDLLNNYGLNEFLTYKNHHQVIVPKDLVLSIDEAPSTLYKEITDPIYSHESCKLHKHLTPILTRYKTNLLNKTLFKNTYPIKTLIDKQVMLKMISDNALYLNYENYSHSKVNLNGYCINPNLARYVGAKVLPTIEILNLLGIDIKELNKYLKKMKKLNYQIVLGGFGGAMTNFIYWLEEFCKITQINNITSHLLIYEYDSLDMSNLPRIPLDYMSSNCNKNLSLGSKLQLAYSIAYCAKEIEVIKDTLNPSSLREKLNKNMRTIIIGSLSSQTRFEEFIIPRIIPLHLNNKIVIYSNLKQMSSSSLIVENYGKIELTYFFFNMVLMTWEIIKELVDNSKLYTIATSNELKQKKIADFSSENWDFKDIQKTNYCLL